MRTYDNMKDSGYPWMGEIPVHWRDINPKALFTQRKERAREGERQLTASQQYGVLYQDEYMALTGSRVVVVQKDFDILKHVEAGDFVISMRSFQGGLEYSPVSGSISSAYVMLIPNKELVYPPFYKWLLKSSAYIRALQSTTDLVRDGQAMRYSNFAKVRLLVAPIEEQMAIAAYLDDRCSQIDSIIEEAKGSIEEYEQWKAATIFEAVTKGIESNIPLKHTSMPFIPIMPSHWVMSKVGRFSIFYNGDRTSRYPKPEEFVDEGIPFLNSSNINGDIVDTSVCKYITKEKYNSLSGAKLQIGDIVYCLRGSIGKCALNSHLSEGTVASSLATIRPTGIDGKYLLYCLLSKVAQEQAQLFMNGTCAANLSAESVSNFYIPVPPAEEQRTIGKYCYEHASRFDELISEKQSLIEDMEQYKRSLIYEAVTGKRKVV